MEHRGSHLSALLMLSLLWPLAGCDRPMFNMRKLEQVRAEAHLLMRTHPAGPRGSWHELPKADWPPSIASLNPKYVAVAKGSVDIVTRPFFDGGWGYNVPRAKRDLPMPLECYSEPSDGVFWHGPC